MASKRLKDPGILHGHHVVSGPELRAAIEVAGEGDGTARIRRRTLHGVVLVLLIGLIAAGIILALAIINGRLKLPSAQPAPTPVASCPASMFDYTPTGTVNVNVYNSTSRPGLARSAADELLARRFVVGNVANISAGYRGVAAVVSGSAGQASAFTVQRHVPGSDYFQDGRTDASVDVILAQDFKALVPPELVDQTPGRLSCPRENRRTADTDKLPVLPAAAPTP
ncbi:LytR C-terminal domain-containing protein [Pseudarthrobacter sp. C4D7]|uniref:LytR C-terminal domain-containing protein n=1 Tax=Pseudarthrobacter sp. C4D7 TaxID=2735268 RepID=UPI001584D7E5|nr:LytR C-terminal domain-containing protein [Pseudarthrobacter sp. C4D7]NUT72523.1 LytR C-terminal domain-containing protein [Pseudarthrobacter sp. C4D7]